MNMNLSWLEDFLALLKSGNFSRAAEQRHMTQPAFSRRVRALEEWLGVALFDRTVQPVTPTAAGQWFGRVAQEILGRIAQLPEDARAVADGSAATLRFAATHALSLTFLPAWLRGLDARVSTGPMHLTSDAAVRCETLLLDGRVQFVLCHAHPAVPTRLEAPAFRSVRVGADTLLPVCAADEAGRPRHPLRGSSGEPVPLLAYSAESGLGRMVRSLRADALADANARPVFTAHLATLLKSMTLQGRGVAWLPRSLIIDELAAGALLPAGDSRWDLAVEIRLFRPRKSGFAAAEAFWNAVVEAAPAGEEEKSEAT